LPATDPDGAAGAVLPAGAHGLRGLARGSSFHRLSPGVRGLLWMAAAGAQYSVLNALLRGLSMRSDPFQMLGLVYACTLPVLLPFVLREGLARLRPTDVRGLVLRGAVHWVGMCLWMVAVTRITLAETTAIGFTSPLFIVVGAAIFFKEPLHGDRTLATIVGFLGVLVIVLPRFTGVGSAYALLMLASAAVFASSFLLSKRLTRIERPAVIVVWQSLTVTAFSVPLALVNWEAPSAATWGVIIGCAVLTTVGNYCLTRAFSAADISASQPAKFLDLVWASILGWLFFGDRPEVATLAGGAIILASTLWVARREAARSGG
jgi:drug/metabolite transporter (DMT)-like permease